MTVRARFLISAVALAAVSLWMWSPGLAQMMAPPPGHMPAPDAMPFQGGGPGMMGRRAMMFDHVEGRIAFLKAELKITEAQTAPWEHFADALRANAGAMKTMHQQMMQGGIPTTLPDRLDFREKMLSAHLDALKAFRAAVEPLYASFNDDQRKTADELMLRPMGMM